MNKKKIATLALSAIIGVTAIASASLAYFTDKTERVENVFTVGGVKIELVEDFEQGSQLIPGVDVNKDVSIKLKENSGDAYVWYLAYYPADLDSIDGTTGTNNALHVNSLGSTWDKYRENSKYWADGQTEALPIERTWDHDPETELGLTAGPEGYLKTVEIDGVEYHVYAALYHGKLSNKEGGQNETTIAMTKVYLDKSVDQDENGYYQIIRKGERAGEKKYLPTLNDGSPKIIIEAYAIQAEGFADVYEAFKAYQNQQ